MSLILFGITAFLLSYVLYRNIFHTFYQQDEWYALGQFFGHGSIGTLWGVPLIKMLVGAGRPLIWPIHVLFYAKLPFQIWPLALFSLTIQPFVAIFLYAIILLLTESYIGAWVGGLVFLFFYNGSQSVFWFATSTVTLASTFFGLLSVLLLLQYVRKKKIMYLVFAQVSVLVSFFFKEAGIMFALFLPFLYALYYDEKKIVMHTLKVFSPLIAYFSFAIIMTIIFLLTPVRQADRFVGQSTGGIWKIIGNAVFYPLLSFSQLFIPFPLVKKISPLLAEVYPLTDTVFVVLSVIFLFGIVISMVVRKSGRKPILAALVFTLSSFVPYAVLTRGASYLSSRYFYVGAVGAGMLIGIYGGMIWNGLKRRSRIFRIAVCGLFIAVLGAYMYKNFQFIERDVRLQVLDAGERLTILNKIKQSYLALPNKPVFYVTGDHPGYYFIENQKMPFQQGIGYTLLVWYYPKGGVSRELLLKAGEKFWDISGQGYIELDGKGFGYYWDKKAMIKDLNDHKFSKDQIIGFYYHSGSRELENSTAKIQGEMP